MPVVALPLIQVAVPDPEYLRWSLRYPNSVDVAPLAAIEAAHDPDLVAGIAEGRPSLTLARASSACPPTRIRE